MSSLVFIFATILLVGANAEKLGGYLASFPSEPELSSRITRFLKDLPSVRWGLTGDTYWMDYVDYSSKRLIVKTVPADNKVSVSVGSLKLQFDSPWYLNYDVTDFLSKFNGSYEVIIYDANGIDQSGKFKSWMSRVKQSGRVRTETDYATGKLNAYQYGAPSVEGEHWNVYLNPLLPAAQQEATDKARQMLFTAGTNTATDLLADQIARSFLDINFVENEFWNKLDSSIDSLATEVNDNLEASTVTVPTVEVLDYFWTAFDTKVSLSLDTDAESSVKFYGPNGGIFETKGLKISISGKYQISDYGRTQPATPWHLSATVSATQSIDVHGEISDPSSLKVDDVQFSYSLSGDNFPQDVPLHFADNMWNPITNAIGGAYRKAVKNAALAVLKQP